MSGYCSVGRGTVLITGAAGGIGQALTRAVLAHGWRAIGVDQDADRLHDLASELGADHREAFRPEVVDLLEAEEIEGLFDRVGRDGIELTGLVNNAGVLDFDRIEDLSIDRWRQQLRINLTAPFITIKFAAPSLCDGAAIVNVSSLAGISGLEGAAAYAAAKAGLIGLTKSVAREMAIRRIRCNAVVPGPVDTAMLAGLSAPVREQRVAPVLLSRAADPMEVAAMITFLLSDAASYITGQPFVVDGGRADKL